MRRLKETDRWYAGLIWLVVCAYGADWSGLHYMVGAFLAGAIMDRDWFTLQTKALIMIIFGNILLDRQVITSETFTALLLMAVASTMLTVPIVAPRLKQLV
ncbi:hypothetical protein [Luteibacter sp.]|uniref:hypothetical protein n=1 Tax=Luteibacter sp. TaxID=1886636 RepID=UPI002F41984B